MATKKPAGAQPKKKQKPKVPVPNKKKAMPFDKSAPPKDVM